MYLLITDNSDRRLYQLIHSWIKPRSKHRKVTPGTIEKLSPTAYIFKPTREALRLLAWLVPLYMKETRLFKIEKELSWKEIPDEKPQVEL